MAVWKVFSWRGCMRFTHSPNLPWLSERLFFGGCLMRFTHVLSLPRLPDLFFNDMRFPHALSLARLPERLFFEEASCDSLILSLCHGYMKGFFLKRPDAIHSLYLFHWLSTGESLTQTNYAFSDMVALYSSNPELNSSDSQLEMLNGLAASVIKYHDNLKLFHENFSLKIYW